MLLRTPSLDSVHRAVRNITAALTEKTFELDDLGNRLDLLRLKPSSSSVSTPSISRSRKPISTPDDTFLVASSRKGLVKTPQVTSPEAVATAKAALNAERKAAMLQRALLAVRSNPVINRTASASTSKNIARRPLSDLQLAFSAGPVTGDHLPSPRRAVVKAVLPKPAPIVPFNIPQPPPSTMAPTYTNSSYNAPPAENLASVLSFTPTATQTIPTSTKPTFGFSTTPKVESPSANSWKLPPAPAPNPSFLPLFSGPLSFAMPSVAAPVPVVGSGARSGASRNSRQHSSAVQLRNSSPSSTTTPTTAAAFDWGIPTSTPGRSSPSRVVEGFVPFSNVVQPSVSIEREEAESGSDRDEEEYSGDEGEIPRREREEDDEEEFSDGSDFDQDEEELSTIPEESED